MESSTAGFRVRKARKGDAEMLSALAEKTFRVAFGGDTPGDDLESYIRENFNEKRQTLEIENPKSAIFIALKRNQLVGYAMLHPRDAPSCIRHKPAIELKRIYVLPDVKGTGVADSLMQAALSEAVSRAYILVWLSCWEINARAISFYRHWKFETVGNQEFIIGRDIQHDIIFQRELKEF